PIRVTENGGAGLLATPNAYKCVPVGAAYVSGGARPDLFVTADRGLERGAYFYRYVRDADDGQPIFAEPVKITHPSGNGGVPNAAIHQPTAGDPVRFYF